MKGKIMWKSLFPTFLFCAALMAMTEYGVASAYELTDADRNALEEGRTGRAGFVLMRLRQDYEKTGLEVVKPVIPALLSGAWILLRQPELGEEGEVLGDYIWLLCKTGDPRTRPFFLELMVNDQVGGLMVAEGLVSLGKSVLPAIEDSLSSPRAGSRIGTVGYLGSMVRMDSTGVFFAPEDRKRIAHHLGKFLTDKDEMMRMAAVRSLGETGDRSILHALEKIRENDSYKSPTGFFIIRDMAARSIEQIKTREIRAK